MGTNAMQPSKLIWHNGRMVPWENATFHVMSHGLHYGTSVFEGIRSYSTPNGCAIFRLADHIQRLFDSARLYRIEMSFDPETIAQACRDVVSQNELVDSYIRPIAFFGTGSIALNAIGKCQVETCVAAVQWGAYLGEEGLKNGIDACISSWHRLTSSSNPVQSKAGGHYLNSQLVAAEAHRNGYVEGIALNENGMISEGSGENIFIVRRGVIYTPPLASSILNGITRDTVIKLAENLGFQIVAEVIPRETLYLADEVFMTGTAAEVTPVRSVDRISVADGKPGPITRAIQDEFFGLFQGRTADQWNWLDHIPVTAASTR